MIIVGKPAYVYFVSPGQINVVAPDTALQHRAGESARAELRAGVFPVGSEQVRLNDYPDNVYIADPSIGTVFAAARR